VNAQVRIPHDDFAWRVNGEIPTIALEFPPLAPVYPNWFNDNLADRPVAQALAEAGRIHQDVFTGGAAQ